MSITLQEYSLTELRYSQLQLENEYSFDVRAKWESFKPVFSKIVETIEKPLVSVIDEDNDNYAILYYLDNYSGLVVIDFSKKSLSVSIASSDRAIIDAHIAFLKGLYPPEPDLIDGKVKIRFWYNTNNGPRNVIRTISVPKWENIHQNYDPATFEGLKFLIDDFKPSGGGQLIIMNGLPGTGKSYYLRALLHSWKDWCSAEYVLDPENLFSGGQGYMADLVLKNSYDEEYDYIEDEDENAGKWKLLILEDSGELLTVDAKERVGQGLSRLLNLVDGLIGQGLRVLVLITTNEDFNKMHSAVIREGRCAATITFNPLSREQASTWLNGTAPKLPVGKNQFTLSELYALVKGTTVKKLEKESASFGFKMR